MARCRVHVLALALLLGLPSGAQAQLDDLLSPLTPPPSEKPEKKVRPKPKRRSPRSSGKQQSPAASQARLTVIPSPSDRPARLFVNGQDRGLIPSAHPLELSPGTYNLEVRRPGYASFEQRVELSTGEKRELVAQLVAAAALLEISANVPDAEVWLDGIMIGRAPIRGWSLPPGSHDLSVKKPGYKAETSALTVKPGREYNIQATLRPEASASVAAAQGRNDVPLSADASRSSNLSDLPLSSSNADLDGLSDAPVSTAHRSISRPFYRRWYFWAGLGAVAIGAGVGGYAMTRGSSGPTPTDVCGGPCAATLNGGGR